MVEQGVDNCLKTYAIDRAAQGAPAEGRISLGISSCLLGEKVRYDGGHKRDCYITDTLGAYFHFVPVCPEVGCGLPVPREPMRLEGEPAAPRLVTLATRRDLTDRMLSYAAQMSRELEQKDLCGFIFKKGSPSCGLFSLKVYGSAAAGRSGRGLFSAAVAQRLPFLPVEEEGRLREVTIRENFIERVFACRRWRDFLSGDRSIGALIDFHASHKLQIMAHSVEIYRKTGRLVAEGTSLERKELLARYQELFAAALSLRTSVAKHSNVLSHIAGYFKRDLTHGEKQELLELLDRYRHGGVPLIVPITLLNHFIRKYGRQYLEKQSYLAPHPQELMLRNHA